MGGRFDFGFFPGLGVAAILALEKVFSRGEAHSISGLPTLIPSPATRLDRSDNWNHFKHLSPFTQEAVR